MDEKTLRIDLLRLVCASLPSPDAETISQMDPHDPDTHIVAYTAVIRTGTRLPDELRRLFYAQFANTEPVEAEEFLQPDPLAHIERTEAEGIVVLGAVGDFDLASVEILRTGFGGALADHSRVVLDMSETTFADSTALGVLVAARKRAVRDGGWVRLVNPRPNVLRLLQITGLDTALGVYATIEQARTASDGQLADS